MGNDRQITGNVGLYYACYRLSVLGLNVLPTARNAKGIDIIAYPDINGFVGIQVKSLSKRNPVPLGESLDSIQGDFWIILVDVATSPRAFIMTPAEVRDRAVKNSKAGKDSFWMQPAGYEQEQFREAWARIAVKPA